MLPLGKTLPETLMAKETLILQQLCCNRNFGFREQFEKTCEN